MTAANNPIAARYRAAYSVCRRILREGGDYWEAKDAAYAAVGLPPSNERTPADWHTQANLAGSAWRIAAQEMADRDWSRFVAQTNPQSMYPTPDRLIPHRPLPFPGSAGAEEAHRWGQW